MAKNQQRWTIYVCPDPECGSWYRAEDRIGDYCDNYEVHPIGDYPKFDVVEVVPAQTAERLAEAADRARKLLGPIGVGDFSKPMPAKDHQAIEQAYELLTNALDFRAGSSKEGQ